MILVAGATGLAGQEICRRLRAEGHAVRALVRTGSDPVKVEQLRKWGAVPVVGDLRNPASLKLACRGAEAVITTVSAMPLSYVPGENDIATTDTDGTLALLRAAGAARVEHFVYLSGSGNVDAGFDFPLIHAKRRIEEAIIASEMTYTILRPSCFMEVWLTPALGFDFAHARATIYGTGTAPVSWIAVSDVARFAAAALTNRAAANTILELGGPEMLSPLQVVALGEAMTGRAFTVQYVPPEALLAQHLRAHDPMQQSLAGLLRAVAQGDPIDMTATLKIFPGQLTHVRDYAAHVLGSEIVPAMDFGD